MCECWSLWTELCVFWRKTGRHHGCAEIWVGTHLLETQGKGLSDHAGVRQTQQAFFVGLNRINFLRTQLELIVVQAARLTQLHFQGAASCCQACKALPNNKNRTHWVRSLLHWFVSSDHTAKILMAFRWRDRFYSNSAERGKLHGASKLLP